MYEVLDAAVSPLRTVSDSLARCEVAQAPPGLAGMPDKGEPAYRGTVALG